MKVLADGGSWSNNSPATDNSPPANFNTAVAAAQAQRQAIDGVPPGGHGLETPVAVQAGDTLMSIAAAYGDTVQQVEADNAQIKNSNLIHPGDIIFVPDNIPGVTQQQSKQLATDHAAAVQVDQTIDALRGHYVNRAIMQELQQESQQDWAKVQNDVQSILSTNGAGTLFPEDRAAATVKALNAVYPGDTKFAAATSGALAAQTQQWQALGVTHDQADPVINAYNAYKAAANAMGKLPRGVQQELQQEVQQDQKNLQTAIETYLKTAYNQQAGSPQEKARAMLERELIIDTVGPQDPAFKNAVAAADTDLQVTQAAQRVAAAYQRGGATAAAQQLKQEVQNALPSYQLQIIEASGSTIGKIADDLNNGMEGQATTSVYADLSAAVEATDHGTNVHQLGDTKTAADFVANILAQHMTNGPTGTPNLMLATNLYQGAKDVVGTGDGASLSFALAMALKQEGMPQAGAVMAGVAQGFADLKTNTDNAVSDFAKTDANLEQLRATWAPFMTKAQLDQATQDYANHHPGFEKTFNQQYAVVQQYGGAVFQAEQAYNAYASGLNGIVNSNFVASARAQLTGTDAKTLFAVMQNGAVASNIAGQLPGATQASAVYGPTSINTLPLSRSARTFLDKFGKLAHNSDNVPITVPNYVFTGLTAAGVVLSGYEAGKDLGSFNQLDIGEKAGVIYNALGFVKYSAELVGSSAKTSIFRFLSADQQNLLSAFPKTAGFSAFKAFYYLDGAFSSGVSTVQAFSQGDPLVGSLDLLNTAGNVALAGDSAIAAAEGAGLVADGALDGLAFLGPAGAAAAFVAQVGLLAVGAWRQGEARDAFMQDGTAFLQDGLGISQATASQLAWVNETSNPQGPGPALLAYAQQYKIPPADLIKFLDRQEASNPTGVFNFLYLCEELHMNNGRFPATDPSDTPYVYYQPGLKFTDYYVDTNNINDPMNAFLNVNSLNQLNTWFQTIFGQGAMS